MNKLIDSISVVAQTTGWLLIYCFQVGLEMEWCPLWVEKKKKKKAENSESNLEQGP